MDTTHDAHQEEQAYAQQTREAIDCALHTPPPDGTALALTTQEALAFLDQQETAQHAALEAARHEPYFGRIDFQPEQADQEQRLYIGKTGVRSSDKKILV